MNKAILKIIASNARSLAEQCDAAAEGEVITPDVVAAVRRSYLVLKSACSVFTQKRTKK